MSMKFLLVLGLVILAVNTAPVDEEEFFDAFLDELFYERRQCSVGTAIVSRHGGQCNANYMGVTATGQVVGTTHRHCTQAKNIAKVNLRGIVPAACHRYITAFRRCSVINC